MKLQIEMIKAAAPIILTEDVGSAEVVMPDHLSGLLTVFYEEGKLDEKEAEEEADSYINRGRAAEHDYDLSDASSYQEGPEAADPACKLVAPAGRAPQFSARSLAQQLSAQQ